MRILSEHEQQPKSTNRLRQRLVGGLVVLALAVLILPLWLDNGGLKTPGVQPVPKAPTISQPAEITIPTPPTAEQQILENPPASTVPATEPMPTDEKVSSGETQPANGPVSSSESTTQNSTSQTPAPSVPSESVKKPAPVASAPVPPATPAAKTPAPSTEKAEAPKPVQAPSPAPVADNQLWVVQLGSFSDELNAKGLARSVSEAGFKVEITPLFAKKGTVWRVRVGPYTNREMAVKATTQLREKLGRDGLVMPK
ncbi:MAG: hypothetical protein B7X28_03280 [Halothiobacillus sp. 13-55-253]|nr:MAG: hypothetical protein B7X28_03280 [Halothiobacillus sp. 13-55-253]